MANSRLRIPFVALFLLATTLSALAGAATSVGTALAAGPTITSVSPLSTVLAVTGGSCTASTPTLTFASTTPPAIGTYIAVSGVSNATFDGNFAVAASTATSVTWAGAPCTSGPGTGGTPTITLAAAKAGDVITVYGSSFGVAEPTGGQCPAQGSCGIQFNDATTFAQGSESWGKSGSPDTILVDSWGANEIQFTIPVPSGTNDQYRVQPETTATFCVTDNSTNCITGSKNLLINNSDNYSDYYDMTERVGISPNSAANCSGVSSTDGGTTDYYGAVAGSGRSSLATPSSGTALTSGSVYTDSSASYISYLWPDVPTCAYDLIDGAAGSYTETLLAPPNSGTGAVTEFGVLGAGLSGGDTANATITYADGTSSPASLQFTDWCGGASGSETVVNVSTRSDGSCSNGLRVFQIPTNTLSAGKVVSSISIPSYSSSGNMQYARIFSMALAECSASPCTSGNTKTYPWLMWNRPGDITQGTPLSSTQLDATAGDTSGELQGTWSYFDGNGNLITPGYTGLPVGTDTLKATFFPSDMSHWVSGMTVTTQITVTAAPSTTISSYDPSAAVDAVTGGSCPGTTATLDFASSTNPPIGSAIVVANVTPSGYNGDYVVTNSTSTSVSYSPISSSGAYTCPTGTVSGGTITVASARPGDVVTVYGSGFGSSEPAGGACPSQGSCGIALEDYTPGFGQNSPENWGQPGNASTITVDSWSNGEITFTVPPPSGSASQYRLEPGTIAAFCVADNTGACLSNTETLPINYSANEADYYDATERIGITTTHGTTCGGFKSIDNGTNFYDATGTNPDSLASPHTGTPLTAGGTITDSNIPLGGTTPSFLSYVWPSAAACSYDLIDGAVTPYFETIQMPPNTGAGAVTELGMLGTDPSGSSGIGMATVIYADGSTTSVPIDFPDWCGGPSSGSNEDLVNQSARSSDSSECDIYQRFNTLSAGKVVKAIQIPTSGGANWRAFSVALGTCSASPCTSGNAQTYPWLLWNHPADLVYGTALGSTQLGASAPNVSGTFTYSYNGNPISNGYTGLPVGADTVTATFTPTGAGASKWVSGTTVSQTITVTEATETLQINPASLTQTYDGSPEPVTVTASPCPATVTYNGGGTVPTDVGPYSVHASNADTTDCTAASDSETENIQQATESLSINSASLTQGYDGSPKPVTVTASPCPADMITYDGLSTPPTSVGSYTVVASNSDTTDCTAGSDSETEVIQAGTPSITWNTPADITYGTALSSSQLDASSAVAGSYSYSPGLGTVLPAGNHQALMVTLTPTDTTNYQQATSTVYINVDPAPLTVTASSPSMTYSGSVPGVTPSYLGFVNGDNPSSLTTAPTCSAPGVTSSTPAGTYPTSCSGGVSSNYALTYIGGTLTIGKYMPALSWTAPAAITYGTALGANQLTAQSDSPGTFAYSPAAGQVLAVGTHQTLSATFTASDSVDYVTGGTVSTSIDVDPATITVTAGSPSMTYGDPTPAVGYIYSGFVNGDNASVVSGSPTCSTTAGPTTPVASSPATTCDITGVSSPNYRFRIAGGSVTVNPATITVTASSPSMTYGDPTPAVSSSYAGFVNGQDQSVITGTPSCSTTAGPTTPVASSPATTCDISGLSSPNYTFRIADGSVLVNPAMITVTASSPLMTYGDPTPAVSSSYSGFVNSEAASVISGSPSCSTTAGPTTPVASSPATTCDISGLSSPNYTFRIADGSVTVNPATLTVTADTLSIAYGTSLPAIGSDITGFVNGEDTSVITGAPSCSTNATAGSHVGTYDTSCDDSGMSAANYVFSAVDGVLTITKYDPVLSWSNPADITYPTALSSTQLDAHSDVPGSFIYSPDTGTVLTAGAGQILQATFYPADTQDYVSGGSATATITVDKYKPVLNWAAPADITYPTALSSAQLDAQSDTPGTFAYSPTLGAVLHAGNGQTLSATFTPSDGSDYVSGGTVTTSLNVRQYAPVLTWNNPADITYGTSLSSTQLDAQADVPGSFAYSPAIGTVPHAGTGQTLHATFTPADTTDYVNGETATATITVRKYTPVVTWVGPGPITYGTQLSSIQLDARADVPGSFRYTPAAGSLLRAGSGQTLSVAFTPTDTLDYAIPAVKSVTITVNKASLWITAANLTLDYSDLLPNLSGPSGWTATGFVNGEGKSALSTPPTCAPTKFITDQNDHVNVKPGAYTISCQGASAANYAIGYIDGTLTIQKEAVALVYAGPSKVKAGKKVTLRATLDADGSAAQPVSGQKLVLSFAGGNSCSATTNAAGVGACSVKAPSRPHGSSVTVIYQGTVDYLSARKSASVKVTK